MSETTQFVIRQIREQLERAAEIKAVQVEVVVAKRTDGPEFESVAGHREWPAGSPPNLPTLQSLTYTIRRDVFHALLSDGASVEVMGGDLVRLCGLRARYEEQQTFYV